MARIAVVGIGAIGSLVANGLQNAGLEPSLLASSRGIGRLLERGLRIHENGIVRVSRPRLTDDAHTLGVQDIVFLCLKEPALRSSATDLAPLVGPDTVVVSMLNGVPWRFARGLAALEGRSPTSLDPDGSVETALPAERCVGCVVYLASSIDGDGVAVAGPPGYLIVGDPDPTRGLTRTERIAVLLRTSGFDVETSDDIRRATWVKLLGNVAMNPLSALTGATVSRLLEGPATLRLVRSMMAEAIAVALAIGIDVGVTIDQRIDALKLLGDTKTSMLQDLEAGRVLEIDAIVAAIVEFGPMTRVPTPFTDAALGLVRLRAAG